MVVLSAVTTDQRVPKSSSSRSFHTQNASGLLIWDDETSKGVEIVRDVFQHEFVIREAELMDSFHSLYIFANIERAGSNWSWDGNWLLFFVKRQAQKI